MISSFKPQLAGMLGSPWALPLAHAQEPSPLQLVFYPNSAGSDSFLLCQELAPKTLLCADAVQTITALEHHDNNTNAVRADEIDWFQCEEQDGLLVSCRQIELPLGNSAPLFSAVDIFFGGVAFLSLLALGYGTRKHINTQQLVQQFADSIVDHRAHIYKAISSKYGFPKYGWDLASFFRFVDPKNNMVRDLSDLDAVYKSLLREEIDLKMVDNALDEVWRLIADYQNQDDKIFVDRWHLKRNVVAFLSQDILMVVGLEVLLENEFQSQLPAEIFDDIMIEIKELKEALHGIVQKEIESTDNGDSRRIRRLAILGEFFLIGIK